MNILLGFSRLIDAVNERIGKLIYWLVLAANTKTCPRLRMIHRLR